MCLISNYKSSGTCCKRDKVRFSNARYVFVFKVGVRKGADGSLKYSKLTALVKSVLYLRHSDPERGFSVNKTLLSVYGASLGEGTIEAVKFVKDFIIRNGGLSNIQVIRPMIGSSQNAKQCYLVFNIAKQRYSYLVKKRRSEEEEKEKIKNNIAESQQKENGKTNRNNILVVCWI